MLFGLEQFVSSYPVFAYLVLFAGMFIEGEIFFITGALFAIEGRLEWLPLLLVTFIGVFLGDLAWYALGRYTLNTRFGCWLDRRTKQYHEWLHVRLGAPYARLAFFSKFLYYVNRIVPFIAGWHSMDFKRFARIHFFAGLFWIVMMGLLAFLFQNIVMALGVRTVLRRLEYIIIGSVVLFVGGEYILKRIFDKRIKA